MNLKKIILSMALMASFSFMACDDDTSSTAAPTGGDEGTTITSSASEGEGAASSADEGAPAYSADEASTLSSSSSLINPLDSFDLGDLDDTNSIKGLLDSMGFGELLAQPECTAANEGAKDTAEMFGVKVISVCKNGEWEPDSAATMEASGVPECTPANEGEKYEQTIMGMTISMICQDGEWVEDNACTEEGATKTESIMGFEMTYKCEDGEWVMDMSNMGDVENFGTIGDVIGTAPTPAAE